MGTYELRLKLLVDSWSQIKNHPFIGVGPGMNSIIVDGLNYKVHNTALLLWSEGDFSVSRIGRLGSSPRVDGFLHRSIFKALNSHTRHYGVGLLDDPYTRLSGVDNCPLILFGRPLKTVGN